MGVPRLDWKLSGELEGDMCGSDPKGMELDATGGSNATRCCFPSVTATPPVAVKHTPSGRWNAPLRSLRPDPSTVPSAAPSAALSPSLCSPGTTATGTARSPRTLPAPLQRNERVNCLACSDRAAERVLCQQRGGGTGFRRASRREHGREGPDARVATSSGAGAGRQETRRSERPRCANRPPATFRSRLLPTSTAR